MAEGIFKSIDKNLEVFSAGTEPAAEVHPKAIEVLKEIGIDISGNIPKKVDQYLDNAFDFVITVCDSANETCPVFTGKVGKRIHNSFEDPAKVHGSEEEVMNSFRKVRDEIKAYCYKFYLMNTSCCS